MLDDLVEEVPGSQGRVRFRHPNRALSVGFFALSVPFLGMACIFYLVGGVEGSESSVVDARHAFHSGSIFCGLIGLLICVLAMKLVWTLRHLEIDVERRTLVDVTRTPFQERLREYGPTSIERIVIRENPPSDNDSSPVFPDCNVEIQFNEGLDLDLGRSSDWRAKRLAQRISDLTGATLIEVKRPR